MKMQEIIDFLKQNNEIGRNKAISDVKIAMGIIKLKQEGFPEPGVDFYKLLRNFNGLSNNGCTMLGINTESTLFPDLGEYNIKHKKSLAENSVILGFNDAFWLVFEATGKKYKIIDKDDASEEGTSSNLADLIPYIMQI